MGEIVRFWSLKHSRSLWKKPQRACFPKTQDFPTAKTLVKCLTQTLNLQRCRDILSLCRDPGCSLKQLSYTNTWKAILYKWRPCLTPHQHLKSDVTSRPQKTICFTYDKSKGGCSHKITNIVRSTHETVGIFFQKARKFHLPASIWLQSSVFLANISVGS